MAAHQRNGAVLLALSGAVAAIWMMSSVASAFVSGAGLRGARPTRPQVRAFADVSGDLYENPASPITSSRTTTTLATSWTAPR